MTLRISTAKGPAGITQNHSQSHISLKAWRPLESFSGSIIIGLKLIEMRQA
jgi:hypothetical protein